eukprot:sb/3467125/
MCARLSVAVNTDKPNPNQTLTDSPNPSRAPKLRIVSNERHPDFNVFLAFVSQIIFLTFCNFFVTFFKERSPYPRERSPYPKDRSLIQKPYPKARSPYPKERSPYPREISLIQKQGPLIQKKGPLILKKGPLIREKGPLIQKKGPLIREKGPLIQKQGPLIQKKGPLILKKGPLIQKKGPLLTCDWRLYFDPNPSIAWQYIDPNPPINSLTMSAQEQMRKMLDQLMGSGRDGAPDGNGTHFTDPTVCRAFMTGLCPHTLFTNTIIIGFINCYFLPRKWISVSVPRFTRRHYELTLRKLTKRKTMDSKRR